MKNLLNLCNVTGFSKSTVLPPSAPSGETWTTKYEANELPESATPAWTKSTDLGTYTAEISSGKLHFSSSDTNECVIWERSDTNLLNSVGSTLEVRVKATSLSDYSTYAGYIQYALADDSITAFLALFSDSVEFWGDGFDEVYAIDTTNDYHTYRISISGTTCTLYIDGVKAKEVTAGTAQTYIQKVTIETSSTPHDTLTDYVYLDTTGAYAPT